MTYQATIRIDRPPLDMDYEAWTPHAPLVWCWQVVEEYAPLDMYYEARTPHASLVWCLQLMKARATTLRKARA